MRLVFTKKVGRFEKGAVRDYPSITWKQIEKSAGMKLAKFTKQADEAAAEASNVR